jgi:hypothetical protein
MDVVEFAKDLAFIAEKFKALRYDPASFFYKRHNSKSCVMGHGKGGSAAILATQYYPDVTTLITLAVNETTVPNITNAALQVTVPAVMVVGGEDCTSPLATVQEPIFNNLASDCKTLINMTTAPRCHFAQDAGICTSNQITCGGITPYIWQAHAFSTTYYLVSFLRYYLKSNAPALDKFEWKLQQKKKDFQYTMQCSSNSPRIAWQPEDADREVVETYEAFNVKLFPNPASAGLNVKMEVETLYETGATVIITDLMGKLVAKHAVELDGVFSEVEILTANLRKGAYLVTVTGIEGRTTRPLIIN